MRGGERGVTMYSRRTHQLLRNSGQQQHGCGARHALAVPHGIIDGRVGKENASQLLPWRQCAWWVERQRQATGTIRLVKRARCKRRNEPGGGGITVA